MTWFKIDDSFYDHPKVFDAPDSAMALWLRAGTWSARNLTDGFVPTGMPARLCDDPDRGIRELVQRGLWSRSKGGYQFHDWSEYQPTREEAVAAGAKMSSGGALGNHRRWHTDKGKKDPRCRYCQGKQDRGTDRPPDQVGDGVPDSGATPPTRPVPTRPDPARPVPSTSAAQTHSNPGPAAPSKPNAPSPDGRRGTRLPDDFEVTESMKAWARENAPIASRVDHDMFVDHWRAQTGQRAVKRDWEATWRNWMRRVQENRSRGSARPNGRATTDERIENAIDLGRRMQAEHDAQAGPKELGA